MVRGGKLDDSWKELFEPRPELVGKIGMMNDIGETFTAAAHYLGIDICTDKPEDGQKILDLLTKQKPAVKLYNSSGTAGRVAAGEEAVPQKWDSAHFPGHKKLHSPGFNLSEAG